MKSTRTLFLLAVAAVSSAGAVEVAIRPDRTLNAVDPRIYGFLLEHIYHSCDNGIWGEEVFNRSFEDRANFGGCYIVGKRKSGAFEARVTGPDSVIGVREGARDGLRTNYVDWHVAEGFVEIASAGGGMRRRRTWRASRPPHARALVARPLQGTVR